MEINYATNVEFVNQTDILIKKYSCRNENLLF